MDTLQQRMAVKLKMKPHFIMQCSVIDRELSFFFSFQNVARKIVCAATLMDV
jgi:hypothetical protein